MASIRRLLMAGVATLLVASACTTISAPPSIPPINIPSLPPINIPSLPPINIPSITIPSFSIPSFSIPSFSMPSNLIPSGGIGQAQCTLITAAEMQTALGVPVTEASSAPTICGFLPTGGGLPIAVSVVGTPSIAGIKSIVPGGEDLTIDGNPAYYVNKAGDQMYVDKADKSLWIITAGTSDMKDKLTAIAQIAVPRV
jgi:hypothetical protein